MSVLTAPTPHEMRRHMGQFASGVTVVTGTAADGSPLGFACQSFASLSLEPPLILICVDHGGRSWPQIAPQGVFTVHVLGADQGELCERFGSSRGRRFEGLDWTTSALGTPSLPDVLLRVHARVHQVVPAGDHDIVIGEVAGLEHDRDANPMLFFRGRLGMPDHIQVSTETLGWGW
ncbi:flavin reductase family protein [Nocardioides sp.]|uniref:flavin reductase family protein n=1 Tax=Nocardioides sp. TaxID=35761 RepID=UPI00260EBEED|nr:flavin reductase family protein [Nocardioides sp.]